MGELMANPSIQQLLDNNNEYWQHKIDSQTNAFKKKIAKMEQLFQKDKTESDKEHKAFLKKMKKSEKVWNPRKRKGKRVIFSDSTII